MIMTKSILVRSSHHHRQRGDGEGEQRMATIHRHRKEQQGDNKTGLAIKRRVSPNLVAGTYVQSSDATDA